MPKKSKRDLNISFGGKRSKLIKYDAEDKSSYVFHGNEDHVLAVAWDLDDAGRGFWRVTVVGFDKKGEILLKEIQKNKVSVAFFGDISVVGAGRNDLYTSDGYADEDIVDAEGNIVNKVTEIHVYPSRD